MSHQTHQDIKSNSPLIAIFPKKLRPYAILARLDRPIGVWLLLLPGLWGITLGANNADLTQIIKTVILFTIGAVIMRGAGCVINDIWDRDLDKHVQRTESRPIASGQISVRQAFIFLAILLMLGLAILLQFNQTTIILGCISIPFIATYPLMKRITWWPQLFLGITFNLTVPMGYAAITGILNAYIWALYVAGILWTIAYDTIYAHQDIEDDEMIGIKSTAQLFGDQNHLLVYACYASSWIISVFAAGLFFTLPLLPAGIYALYQSRMWKPHDKTSALKTFKAAKIYGLLMLAGLVIMQSNI